MSCRISRCAWRRIKSKFRPLPLILQQTSRVQTPRRWGMPSTTRSKNTTSRAVSCIWICSTNTWARQKATSAGRTTNEPNRSCFTKTYRRLEQAVANAYHRRRAAAVERIRARSAADRATLQWTFCSTTPSFTASIRPV